MKLKIALMGLLCLCFSAYAQQNTNDLILKIGDRMPDVHVTGILNSREKAFRIADFRGQLLLLDFWSVHCSSCINNFPKLDSLQRMFKGKIKILLVDDANAHDTKKDIVLLLKRLKSWQDYQVSLPIICQDTTFIKYFKFHTIPNCAWIDQDGKLVGLTDDDPLNAENIQKLLNHRPVDLPLKDDYAIQNTSKP